MPRGRSARSSTGLMRTISFMVIVLHAFQPFLPGTPHALAASTHAENLSSQEPSNRKQYWRATLETLGLLGFVSAYYWTTLQYLDDFDYDVSLETLEKKHTGEAVRFDDNGIDNNSFPGHPMAGAYYYLIARNQYLSRAESLLWSFTASYLHEAFIEFTEVFSINDMIVTPVGGAIIGESLYQLGRHLRCSQKRHNIIYKIMSAVIDPIALLNSFIWKDASYTFSDEDTCNATPIQSEFGIFSGMSTVYYDSIDRFKTRFIVGFHGKLYLIPHYGEELDRQQFFQDTALVELALEVSPTDDGINNFAFYAKTVWAAYHRQQSFRDQAGNVLTYSFLVGPASAFEHVQYDTNEFNDWIGAVHVLGPSIELTLFRNINYIRIGVDIFADFAMVRSFAFNEYRSNHTLEGIKSVLRRHNYYYAFGVTVNPKIEIKHESYRFIAEYKYSYYDSFEGADRKEPLTNDFHLDDARAEYRVLFGRRLDFIAMPFFQQHQVWAEAEVRRRERSGFIADDAVTHDGGNTWFLFRIRIIP
jgi:hypothetical protein